MIWVWIGFILFVLLMLALDLGVFHRKAHVLSVREALRWSGVWGPRIKPSDVLGQKDDDVGN